MLFSFGFCCFAYGLIAGRYKIFPYALFRDARVAALALIGSAQTDEVLGLATYRKQPREPVAEILADKAGDELILIGGGPGYLQKVHPDGCLAWAIDREGKVRHAWPYQRTLWDDLERVSSVPGISGEAYPVGMHLFEDGSLLVTFHAQNTFPFAVGMAKFDVNGNVLWQREILSHHWFSVADNGHIYVPGVQVVDSPVSIGQTAASIVSTTGKIYSDVILELDADGELVQEISLLDAFFHSGWEGLFTRPDSATAAADFLTDDPLHLNDVVLVDAENSRRFPWLNSDDLLVSFRSINTVGILDSETHRFKWMSSGAAVAQHSPRFLGDGVVILDNLGGDQSTGGTQLVQIDLPSGRPQRIFPRPGVPLPELCRTVNSGHLDIHPSQERLLMTVTHMGTVWEIDPASGKVLWEYIYVHADQNGKRGSLNTAKYIRNASFLNRDS